MTSTVESRAQAMSIELISGQLDVVAFAELLTAFAMAERDRALEDAAITAHKVAGDAAACASFSKTSEDRHGFKAQQSAALEIEEAIRSLKGTQ